MATRFNSQLPLVLRFQFSILFCLALIFGLVSQTQATILTFEGNGTNINIPSDFGSNVSVGSAGIDVSNGATPNITLSWSTTAPDGWEFYDDSEWQGAAQMDDFEPGITFDILFTPDNGYSVTVSSFVFDDYVGYSTGNTRFEWALYENDENGNVIASGTDRTADGQNLTVITGMIEFASPVLLRMTGGFDNSNEDGEDAALDNITFTQQSAIISGPQNETNYTLNSASTTRIELGGTTDGSYGRINATGTVTLGGTLQITESISETAGMSFDILNWGLLTSATQFDDVVLPALSGGLAWDLSNLYVDGSISIVNSPGSISIAPKLWLDASDTGSVVRDASNNVSQWSDKSGSDIDFNVVSNFFPLYQASVINGRPALNFDGDQLSASAITLANLSQASLFIVAKRGSNDSEYILQGRSFSVRGGSVAGTYYWHTHFDNQQIRSDSTALNTNTDYLISTIFDGTQATDTDRLSMWSNGVEQNLSTTDAWPTTTGSVDTLILSRQLTGANPGTLVDIAEVVIHDTALNAADQQSVETHLSLKYGINANQNFISTWQTTSPNESITLPLLNGGNYNFSVDYGDGSGIRQVTSWNDADATHTYSAAGNYTVTIYGTLEGFAFANGGDRTKIRSVDQWGSMRLGYDGYTSAGFFWGASNLDITAVDAPDLTYVTNFRSAFRDTAIDESGNLNSWDVSGITNMQSAFENAVAFNGDISAWDVSNVVEMRSMFRGATSFNQNIGGWNVSSVTSLRSMFNTASQFNQNISSWNVSSVTTMQNMFLDAVAFNQNINVWNVSNVTSMQGMFNGNAVFNQPLNNWNVSAVNTMESMFRDAVSFDQPLDNWDVSSVTTMEGMFNGATAFNQPIGGWDVSAVIIMEGMIRGAVSFNQPLNSWNVSSVTDMSGMFNGSTAFDQSIGNWNVSNVVDLTGIFNETGLSTENYDALLVGWNARNLQPNVRLDAGSSQYTAGSAAETARNNMITSDGWIINDAGINSAPSLATNTGSTLVEGGLDTILNSELNEGDPDSSGAELTFSLDTVPSYGVLWVDTDNNNVVTSGSEAALLINGTFTQADIDNGLLKYQHGGGQFLSDSFQFDVSDGGALPLTNQTFVFTITNVNDAPTGLPVISGSVVEDQVLTVNTSGIVDEDGLGNFNYQWRRGVNPISTAVTTVYTLGDADVGQAISVTVSYIDEQGQAESVTSLATAAVSNLNDNPVGVPTVSGSPTVGQTLSVSTASLSDADGLGSFSYQWLRNGLAINGANQSTYLISNAETGTRLSIRVSYTDGQGTAESVTSVETSLVTDGNETPTGSVIVLGSAIEDQVLTADASGIADLDGLGPFFYQWTRNGGNIGGATATTYQLTDADVGAQMRVVVSYTDGGGTDELLTSAATQTVTNVNDAPTGGVFITGSAVENQTLGAITSSIADDDGLGVFSYQWLRSGNAIAGATSSTYLLVDADVSQTLTVQVNYTDLQGTQETLVSTVTSPVANVNDPPQGLPVISGNPLEQQTLTAQAGSISDEDGLGVLSYQWLRNGNVVAGANQTTYPLTANDIGFVMAVRLSYTDGQGTNESVQSANTAPIANANDSPTGNPLILGSFIEDETLSIDISNIADVDGLGTFSFQWLRGTQAITGETGEQYTLDDIDVGNTISVRVSYVDGNGTSESVTSLASAIIANVNDAPTGGVQISGAATEDVQLEASTVNLQDDDGLGSFNYQWNRSGDAIEGATGLRYRLTDDDVGSTISLTVTYTDGQGTLESVTSASTNAVINVNDLPTGVPTIVGSAQENQTLTVDTNTIADDDGLGVFSYQWLRSGAAIAGANSDSYTVQTTDIGGTISITVNFTDGQGTQESLTSAATGVVTNENDPVSGLPIISGTATEDETLTVDTSGISDADGLGTFAYQWLRDGNVIDAAMADSYTLLDADVGATLQVQVSYTDQQGTQESVTSNATAIVTNVNDSPIGEVLITGTTSNGEALTADTGSLEDDDGLGVFAYQWFRDGGAIVGATNATYLLTVADVGFEIYVTVSYVDGQGTAESASSVSTPEISNFNTSPTGLPVIIGNLFENEILIADTSSIIDLDGIDEFSYQWRRDTVAIIGATEETYTLIQADVGSQMSVTVSYLDDGGTQETLTSVQSSVVVNVNDAPQITQGDSIEVTMSEDGFPVDFSLALAATDVDGDTFSWSVCTEASNGSASVVGSDAAAVVDYNPTQDFNGRDQFVVCVSDTEGLADQITVNVIIDAKNDLIIAADDVVTIDEDNAFVIDVLANDQDVDGDLNVASARIVESPLYGSARVNVSNGEITYTPNEQFFGNDSFTYAVSDTAPTESNAATVSITVNAVNDAPIAVNDFSTTLEDTPVTINVLDNDYENDASDLLLPETVTVVTQPTLGVATVLSGAIEYSPNLDSQGTDQFTYTITDASGATSLPATVTVSIDGLNDRPSALDDLVITPEDQAVTFNPLSNDTDADGTIDVTSLTVLLAPAHGQLEILEDGSVTYSPDADYNETEQGTDQFTYFVLDDRGGASNVATVRLSVTAQNDAPIANNDNITLVEGSSIVITVLANDQDAENQLNIQAVQVITPPQSGTTSVNNATGQINYQPDPGYFGADQFTYQVADQLGELSNIATVTITIDAVNNGPIARDDTFTIGEDAVAQLQPLDNDVDIDSQIDLNSLTILSPPTNGVITVLPGGIIEYLPDANFSGSDLIIYTVNDLDGLSSNVAQIDLTITPVNDAPTVVSQPESAYQLVANDLFSLRAEVDDVDSQTLVYRILNKPDWLFFNDNTGSLTGVPGFTDAGLYESIQVIVSDGVFTVELSAFDIEVVPSLEERETSFTPLEGGFDETGTIDNSPLNGETPQVSDTEGSSAPPPLVSLPEIVLNATGYFSSLPAQDMLSLFGSSYRSVSQWQPSDGYRSGQHIIYWIGQTFDDQYRVVPQSLAIYPLVNFEGRTLTLPEGADGDIKLRLSGDSPEYPLIAELTVRGTATAGVDHTLVDGEYRIESGDTLTIPFSTITDNRLEDDETLGIRVTLRTLDDYRIGTISDTRVIIRDGNVAPDIRLSAMQGETSSFMVLNQAEPVVVSAQLSDANAGDTLSVAWEIPAGLVQLSADDAILRLDVSSASAGVYPVTATVTDQAGLSSTEVLNLRVVTRPANLSTDSDLDGDGISDLEEGVADRDQDYIPDYLDQYDHPNVLPLAWEWPDTYHLEAGAGLQMSLGLEAISLGWVGALIDQAGIDRLIAMADDQNAAIGFGANNSLALLTTPQGYGDSINYYSLQITELKRPGVSAALSIPVNGALSAQSTVLISEGAQWRAFQEDQANTLYSVSGQAGVCPEPVSYRYIEGIITGSRCLMLEVEDGGLNDRDGSADGKVDLLIAITTDASIEVQVPDSNDQNSGDDQLAPLAGDDSAGSDTDITNTTTLADGSNPAPTAASPVTQTSSSGGVLTPIQLLALQLFMLLNFWLRQYGQPSIWLRYRTRAGVK